VSPAPTGGGTGGTYDAPGGGGGGYENETGGGAGGSGPVVVVAPGPAVDALLFESLVP
jgi:hypothetical protein